MFPCFGIEKNIDDWLSTIEKELVVNKIIDNKNSEIYLDLHLISIFNAYDSEFDYSQRETVNQIYNDNGITINTRSAIA
ncbi:hypothetical protein ACFSTE_02600 [Aquimarina hainanensis]|uniref:Uncharacterized protein n=1 Tax=Aquimarina hainanensis TaxID=1578017 RepID=A0ABW5N275_9FLAO